MQYYLSHLEGSRLSRRTRLRSLILFTISALMVGPVLPSQGDSPGVFPVSPTLYEGDSSGIVQAQDYVRTYLVSGTLTEANLTRLREALGRVEGVEKVEARSTADGATLRIHGSARPNALMM